MLNIRRATPQEIISDYELEQAQNIRLLEKFTDDELQYEINRRQAVSEGKTVEKKRPNFLKLYNDDDGRSYRLLFKIVEYNEDGTPSYIIHTHGNWDAFCDISKNLITPDTGMMEPRTYDNIELISFDELKEEQRRTAIENTCGQYPEYKEEEFERFFDAHYS